MQRYTSDCLWTILRLRSLQRTEPLYGKLRIFVGTVGRHHASGGAIVTPSPGPITRYVYPNPLKAKKALNDTVGAVALAARTCNRMLHEIPRSPYSIEQIQKITGTELGMSYFGTAKAHKKPH